MSVRTGDVIGLGGAAGGVDEHDGTGAEDGVVKGSGEELVVGAVDGVSALEGNNVLAYDGEVK
jgi:hypothetical protein